MKFIVSFILAIAATVSAFGQEYGVAAHWSFDTALDGVVLDSSENQNHGTSTGLTYTQGVIGKAAYFDGVNSKVTIPHLPESITNLKKGSISCWFKFKNIDGQVLPILYLGKATPGKPDHSMVLEVGHNRGDISNRKIYLTTIIGRSDNFCVDSNFNLEEDRWYHYVAVVSKKGNTIYIDGKEVLTRKYNLGSDASYTTFFNDVPAKELLSIGYGKYSQEDSFYHFKGYLDEVIIFDHALSDRQVKALFNQGDTPASL